MSSLESIELYDPESPSDDLCHELSQSSTCKDSLVQGSFESTSETEDAENHKVSAGDGSNGSTSSLRQSAATLCLSDDITPTDKPAKLLDTSEPDVVWRSAEKVSDLPSAAFNDDDEAAEDNAVKKTSSNVSPSDTNIHLPDASDIQKLEENSQLLQRECSDSANAANDRLNSGQCNNLFTENSMSMSSLSEAVDKVCESSENHEYAHVGTDNEKFASDMSQKMYSSDPDRVLNDVIDDIEEPSEPCDADQVPTLPEQPRVIKLTWTEDPAEPGELLETSDTNSNSEQLQWQCSGSDNVVNDRLNSGECDGLNTENSLSMSSVLKPLKKVSESSGNHKDNDVEIDDEKFTDNVSQDVDASEPDSMQVLKSSGKREEADVEIDSEKFMNVTPEKTQTSDPDSVLNDVIDDIEEPSEPCDIDQVPTLPEQPRVIKLTWTEDSAEPDELPQTSDTNSNNEQLQWHVVNDRLNSGEVDGLNTENSLSMSSVLKPLEKVSESSGNDEDNDVAIDDEEFADNVSQEVHASEPDSMEVWESSGKREEADVEIDSEKFMNVTPEKTQTSDPDSVLNDVIDDIEEPSEPCDIDQVLTLPEQPRVIKLTWTEDPAEPDELLESSDTNSNNEQLQWHVVNDRLDSVEVDGLNTENSLNMSSVSKPLEKVSESSRNDEDYDVEIDDEEFTDNASHKVHASEPDSMQVWESSGKREEADVEIDSEKFMNVTPEKTHTSDPDSVLNDVIDDIEEPSEPCDIDQVPTLPEQPRVIKLTWTEKPAEPGELLESSDTNSNSEQLQWHVVNDRLDSGEVDGLNTENSLNMSSVSKALEKVSESSGNDEDNDVEIDDEEFTDNVSQEVHASEPDSMQVWESSGKREEADVEIDSEKFMNVTPEKTHTSDPDSVLNDAIDDIEEPSEPCNIDQVLTLPEQPRVIKLTRTEDPAEPDELLESSDTNSNNEQLQWHVANDRLDSGEVDGLNTENSLSMSSVSKALAEVSESSGIQEDNDVEIDDEKFTNNASQKVRTLDPGSMLLDSSFTNNVVDFADPKAMEKVCESSGNREEAHAENDSEKCMNVTSEKTHTSDPDSMLNDSHINVIDDIAEPTEPFDADQTLTFPEQPRIIQLTRIVDDPSEPGQTPNANDSDECATCPQIIEDPSEPDELLQTFGTRSNNVDVMCPRIIRLDRESDDKVSSHPVAQPCEISDPSEPSDTEPLDDEFHQFIPREIKLDREELVTRLRVIQSNTLLAKSRSGGESYASVVAQTYPCVNSPEGRTANESMYCDDMPLSPLDSVESASDSDCDDRHSDMHCSDTALSPAGSIESRSDTNGDSRHCNDMPVSPADSVKSVDVSNVRHSDMYCSDTPLSRANSLKSLGDRNHDERLSSERSVPRFIVLEDCSYDGMSDVENSSSLSPATSRSMKSDRSVFNQRYLSDGEIVDEEEEEEEFGIFQVPKCAISKEPENHNAEQCKKKSGKRKSREDTDDDSGPQCHNESENGVDHSRSIKQQKVSKDACRSTSSRSSSVSEHHDESIDVPVQQLLYETSKLPVGRRQVTRKDGERSSVSPEKLLVGTNHSTKRKVVVISKAVDESKKSKRSPVKVTDKRTPRPVHDSPCDMLESEKRTSNKRKHVTSKRHHKRHTHRNELRDRKHKWKHKKHKRVKHRSDAGDDFEKRRSRSRARSYNRIVEMIRREEQLQSSNVRHIPSFVVHQNTLVSARHRSSSVSSSDSRHSFDNVEPTPVSQNSDHTRTRNVSGDHTGMHLSRLSYTGETEQDVRNTLLGECIKSKYGPEYDVNCISRNLAYLCSSGTDEVEIVGVSYSGDKQSRNNNLHNVDSGGRNGNDRDYERVQVTISSDQQPPRSVDRSSATVEEPIIVNHRPPRNDIGTNKTGAKKVALVSKEVQTQESLFTETDDHPTESSVVSDSTMVNPGHGKADKELQVSDLDNEQECIHSPSSPADVGCNTDVVAGIQSPEHRIEETTHVPRPVLLDRADAQQPTMPDSQDFSDLYFTVRNFAKPLSLTRNISSQRVEKSVDATVPPVATSGTSITLENGADRLQRSIASGTEVHIVSTAGRSRAADTEHLPSKNIDSSVVKPPSINSVARNKEPSRLSSVPAPAVHQLPPVVQPYKHAVPLRRVNPMLSERLTAASGAVHLPPSTSSVRQVQNKPVAAVKSFIPSHPTLTYKSLSGTASGGQADTAVVGGLSSRETQNIRSAPELPESRPFLTSVDRIPGICEDAEADASQSESRAGGRATSLSAYQASANSLGVINVVTTSAAATASVSPQRQTVAASDSVAPRAGTSSYWTPDALGLSSGLDNSASTLNATVAAGAGSSADMQPVAACLLPLLSTLTTCLLQTPLQQPMPAAGTITNVSANTTAPAVNSRNSLPALNHGSTNITSTDDAVSAWITSLPPSATAAESQPSHNQPSSLPLQSPCPCPGLDFDVDAVESPRSDEIFSFSPPSSEHMMSVIKMKHTLGLKNKSAKKTTNGIKQPTKTGMTVSLKN